MFSSSSLINRLDSATFDCWLYGKPSQSTSRGIPFPWHETSFRKSVPNTTQINYSSPTWLVGQTIRNDSISSVVSTFHVFMNNTTAHAHAHAHTHRGLFQLVHLGFPFLVSQISQWCQLLLCCVAGKNEFNCIACFTAYIPDFFVSWSHVGRN